MSERRQIAHSEKQEILERQGMRCFIDNHPFDDAEGVQFDHIHAFAGGGATTVANIGAVCKKHNRDKGTLSLSEYRDRLALKRFFEGAKKRRHPVPPREGPASTTPCESWQEQSHAPERPHHRRV